MDRPEPKMSYDILPVYLNMPCTDVVPVELQRMPARLTQEDPF